MWGVEVIMILPERKYLCPDCGTVTKVPEHHIDAQCPRCGILVFRPLGDAGYTNPAAQLTFQKEAENVNVD